MMRTIIIRLTKQNHRPTVLSQRAQTSARPLSRAAATFPAGANQIRLARGAPADQIRLAAEFGATS